MHSHTSEHMHMARGMFSMTKKPYILFANQNHNFSPDSINKELVSIKL